MNMPLMIVFTAIHAPDALEKAKKETCNLYLIVANKHIFSTGNLNKPGNQKVHANS